MITFNPSTEQDITQIKLWAFQDIDPDHQEFPAEWWLTGTDSIVAFRLDDSTGAICYVRMNDEAPFARLNTQFAPESEVSKKRLITGLLEGFPILAELMRQKGFKGIVFESTSRSLIKFMSSFGFIPRGGSEFVDDHVLMFQEKATQ